MPPGVMERFNAGDWARAPPAGSVGRHVRRYRGEYPGLAAEIDAMMQKRELPAGWDRTCRCLRPIPRGVAGRDASGKVLNVLAKNVPWLLGGSADLGPSNKTTLKFGAGISSRGATAGRTCAGIRASMAAVMNRMAAKLRAFGATFFHLQRLPGAGDAAFGG